MRRSSALVLAGVLALSGAVGCDSMLTAAAPTYRTTQKDSYALAYQTAAVVASMRSTSKYTFDQTLQQIQNGTAPLIEQLSAQGWDVWLEMQVMPKKPPSLNYDAADLRPWAVPHDPSTQPPGTQYSTVALPKQFGIPMQLSYAATQGIAGLGSGLTFLNIRNDQVERRAFALQVLQMKIQNGETQIDPADPNRPAAESLQDIGAALKVLADEHARIADERAELLALCALVDTSTVSLLRDQATEAKARSDAFAAAHPQPTLQDFNVRVAALPSADDMLAGLKSRLGYVGKLVSVAKAVVSKNPSAILGALADLAPEDTTVHTVLAGAASATKGDIKGTIEAIATLTGHEDDVRMVEGRLHQAQGLIKEGKGFLNDPASILTKVVAPQVLPGSGK